MAEDVMKRNSHTIDLLTMIGMMASITGIFLCLFFLFTPVTFGAMGTNTMTDRSPDLHISMRWIQPILGQAIVEDALIRQRSNNAFNATRFLEESSRPAPGSVQWVVGRVIVELNRSRMVSGLPTGGRQKDDQRIVTIARYAAEQLQEGVVDKERLTANVDLTF
jgi:hypothetical protein